MTLATSKSRIETPRIAGHSQRTEFLVVWRQAESGIGGSNIVAQRISARGEAIGNSLIIAQASGQTASSPQADLQVVYHPNRAEYLVVYQRGLGALLQPGIYARRVSENGQAGDSEAFLYPSGEPVPFTVTVNSTGYLLVLSGGAGIQSTAGGFEPGSPIRYSVISPTPANSVDLPAGNPNAQPLLVFEAPAATGSGNRALPLSQEGLALDGIQEISPPESAARSPAITTIGSDYRFAVAWTSRRGKQSQVFVRQLLADGTPAGRVRRIVRRADVPALLTVGSDQRALLLWLRGAGQSVWARLLDGNLVPSSRAFRIASASTNDRPEAAMTSSGDRALVVWSESPRPGLDRLRVRATDVSGFAKNLAVQIDAPRAISVSAGSLANLTYRIRIRNNSPNTAFGVEIRNSLRGRATTGFTSDINGKCDEGRCVIGDLAGGQQINLRINAGIFSADLGCQITPGAPSNLSPQVVTFRAALSWRNAPPGRDDVEAVSNTSVSCVQ